MAKAQQQEYEYAKVDEPLVDGTSPMDLTILDGEGNELKWVIEANAKEG